MNSKEQQRRWCRQKGGKICDAEYVERWFTEAWGEGRGGSRWLTSVAGSSVQVNCYARASTLGSGWRTGEGKREATLSKSTAIKVKVRITPNLIKCAYSRPLKGRLVTHRLIPVLSIISEIHFQFCTRWFQYVYQFKALLNVCESKKAVISSALCRHSSTSQPW